MKKNSRHMVVFLLVIVLSFSMGCSMISSTLDKLKEINPFAEATATPTFTPQPTATPRAPVEIYACPDLVCPEALLVDDLLGFPADDQDIYPVMVPLDKSVNLSMDWTVLDEATLQESLPDVKWIFTIDGQDYFQEDYVENTESFYEGDPTGYPAAWLSVNLSGWEDGESHFVCIGLELQKDLSDGWVDLPAGHTFIKKYKLIAVKPPTATATFEPMDPPTPEPTATATLKPAPTKAPLKPTATQAANLVYDMTLKVTNLCDQQHVVIMTGPTRLKYTVDPGQTVEYQAPQGTYTWMIDNTYPGGPQDLNINIWTLTLCN